MKNILVPNEVSIVAPPPLPYPPPKPPSPCLTSQQSAHAHVGHDNRPAIQAEGLWPSARPTPGTSASALPCHGPSHTRDSRFESTRDMGGVSSRKGIRYRNVHASRANEMSTVSCAWDFVRRIWLKLTLQSCAVKIHQKNSKTHLYQLNLHPPPCLSYDENRQGISAVIGCRIGLFWWPAPQEQLAAIRCLEDLGMVGDALTSRKKFKNSFSQKKNQWIFHPVLGLTTKYLVKGCCSSKL